MTEEQKLLRVKMNFVLMLARASFEIINHPGDYYWDSDSEDAMDRSQTETLWAHLETIQDILNQENVRDIKFAWGGLMCRDEREEEIEKQSLEGHPEDGAPGEEKR